MKVYRNLLMCEIICLYYLSLLQLVYCSHEDIKSTFDSKQYIGKVKFAFVDPLTPHSFVVATEENVVACLSTETGKIIWRQNLEKGKASKIDALSDGGSLMVVYGGGRFIKFWDHKTGELLWESFFPHPLNSEAVNYFEINVPLGEIIKIEILPKKNAKVYVYNIIKGSLEISDNIDCPWFDRNIKCYFFTSKYFICVEPDRKVLQQLDVKNTSALVFRPVLFSTVFDEDIPVLNVKDIKLISLPHQHLKEKPFVVVQLGNSTAITQINDQFKIIKTPPYILLTSTFCDNSFTVFSVYRHDSTSNENYTYGVRAVFSEGYRYSFKLTAELSLSKERDDLLENIFIIPYTKNDDVYNFKMLLLFEDNTMLLYNQQGQVIWSREEALPNVSLKIHRDEL